MQSPVLSSTFFLTLLMMIGLVFFIRASTKERIEIVQFAIAQPVDSTLEQLQSYFLQRSYQSVTQTAQPPSETTTQKVSEPPFSSATKQIFKGRVRPSVFLAVLLFVLASIGFLCLALVLSILLPQLGSFIWALVLLAPAASVFYWQKSSRIEQVSFKIEPFSLNVSAEADTVQSALDSPPFETKVTVMGHRDELASLQQALVQQSLSLRMLEPELG